MIAKSFLLQLAIGLFFIVLGLMGVLPGIDEGIFSLSNANPTVEVIVGVIELLAGLIVVAGLLSPKGSRSLGYAFLVIFVLWAIRVAYTKFFAGFPFVSGNAVIMPALLAWLLYLLAELVILMALWHVAQNYPVRR
jgi:hypothetical protein